MQWLLLVVPRLVVVVVVVLETWSDRRTQLVAVGCVVQYCPSRRSRSRKVITTKLLFHKKFFLDLDEKEIADVSQQSSLFFKPELTVFSKLC